MPSEAPIKPFFVTLIRHGQTMTNSEGIIQSWTGGELSNEGIRCARELGAYLRNSQVEVTRVFSSDLKRTIDTTLNLREGYGSLPRIQLDQALRERDFGDLEFFPVSLIRPIVPPSLVFEGTPMPSGEPVPRFFNRIEHFLKKMCTLADSTSRPENILVVTHGAWISSFRRYIHHYQGSRLLLEGWDEEKAQAPVLNTSQTRFQIGEITSEGLRLFIFDKIGDIEHLQDSK